jgi:ribosomal protein S18 acetylase RimI-like enzyme
MRLKREFRLLADEPHPQECIPVVAPWVHEAASAYFDWLFGSADKARAVVRQWMARPGSEISITRTAVLLESGRPVGCFVALSGAQLSRCAKADAIATLQEAKREGGRALLDRAATASAPRIPVEPDEFFLSRIAVSPELRGAGRGRALLEEYLAAGRRAGFRRYRLDVTVGNIQAEKLYESVGFRRVAATASDISGMELVAAMAMDVPRP